MIKYTPTLPQTDETIEELFKNGDCLTFDPIGNIQNVSYCLEQVRNNPDNRHIVSKQAQLTTFNKAFHYFNNGLLLCSFIATPKIIEQYVKMLKAKGYFLREVSGALPKDAYSLIFFNKINEYAGQKYDFKKDLLFKPYPPKDEFINQLFANENICLTASKKEDIEPSVRKYLALFSDGRFIVSQDYNYRTHGRTKKPGCVPSLVLDFASQNKNYLYFYPEYVPQDYIDAIYEKSLEFDWSCSEKKAKENYIKKHQPLKSSKLWIEMNQFIADLIKNNECLTVTIPSTTQFSPDRDNYALFADGRLLFSEKNIEPTNNNILRDMQNAFPDLNIKVETVPHYFIAEIYNQLLSRQEGAVSVYLKMLEQKAEELLELGVTTPSKVRDLAAKISGWDDWNEACKINEQNARYAIRQEQIKPPIINNTEYEYKKYCQTHPEYIPIKK